MGLYDTLVSLKNLVTGGSAEVVLDVEPLMQGVPFNITVQVRVAAELLKIRGAYLKIQGVEDIEVPINTQEVKETGKRTAVGAIKKTVKCHTVTSEQKIQIAKVMELEANEDYKWDAIAKLAPDNGPVYRGIHCNHHYRIKAYLDCYGNDPDSGWIDLEIA